MFRRLCSFGAPTLLTCHVSDHCDTIVISDDDDGVTNVATHNHLFSNTTSTGVSERVPAYYLGSNYNDGSYSATGYASDCYNTTTGNDISGYTTGYGAGYITNIAEYSGSTSTGFGGGSSNLFPAEANVVDATEQAMLPPHHHTTVSYSERRQALRQPVRATDLGFESALQSTPLRSNDRHITAYPTSHPQPTTLHHVQHPTSYREIGSDTFRPDIVSRCFYTTC